MVTETHLRPGDVGSLRVPHYYVVTDCSRPTPVGKKLGGGVAILAHENFMAEEIKEQKGAHTPTIESCAIRLFPTEDPRTVIQITGIYMAPSRLNGVTMPRLLKLSNITPAEDHHDICPHLIGGDLNTPSWSTLYNEWIQEGGMIELIGPVTPTFALGTAIDKFLFVPGSYIRSTLLSPWRPLP